jgi:mannitol-1-phosphate 5-dehydrogenase
MIKAELTADECAWFDENVGLVEASIGRMVPVQTDEMKDGNPLRVCVERYGFLPVDKAAFKGEIPNIKNMVPFEPFDFYIKRKLYIHNMGHATCAYLGDLLGLPYIYQAIDVPQIRIIVENAMLESALALSKKYGVELSDIRAHIEDLLFRFTNEALKDTCQRVGGDPTRKLSPEDRLVGASRLAVQQGVCPCFMAIGGGATVYRYIKESDDATQSVERAKQVLETVSGLSAEDETAVRMLHFYEMILNGADLSALHHEADRLKAQARTNVI